VSNQLLINTIDTQLIQLLFMLFSNICSNRINNRDEEEEDSLQMLTVKILDTTALIVDLM
jgi:hypothetical protein